MSATARRWPAIVVAAATPVAAIPAAIAADAPSSDENLEEIIVTGSRIQQRLEDAPVPVIVVDRDAIERASQDSIGKVLQQIPINTGFAQNTNVNSGGDGSTRLNLRGLGSERTVVLVNGRRFVYGGNGGNTSVDVNMIPLSLVERVEVVGVGSSTIYGADAIGGVVNMITRDDYQGAELSGSYTTNDQNDGHVYDISFVAGQSSDRAFLVFGAELVDQHEVFQAARDYSKQTEFITADGSIATAGTPAVPQGYFELNGPNALGLEPGAYTRVNGSGNPPMAADFRLFCWPEDVVADPQRCPSTDLYDYAPVNYLQTPSKREYLWLLGGYDVSDYLSFFVEALVHHRGSEQLLASTPFWSIDPTGGAYIFPDGEPGIPADNYYNPFGVDLRYPDVVLRRFVESEGRRFTEDVKTQWYVAGARGTIGDSTWNWEFSVDYGKNDTDVTTQGEFRADHLQLALGHSGLDAAGNIVCSSEPVTGVVPDASIIPGCVPMNLFGGQGPDGTGTITKAMLDYTTATLTDQGYNEQQIYELILRGDWGAVQDRPVRWAVGGSHRVESAAAKLDPAKISGVAGDTPTNLNDGGEITANELYAESIVPLLADMTAAQELNLTGGLRYSDFSSFGSVTTYQAGLMYRPFRAVTLRGGYGTVFRAPPIVALYESTNSWANSYYDPCGHDPTPAQQANCEAAGVPGGSYVQDENDQFVELFGGNRDLQPEEGDSASAGITISPPAIPGLDFSVDYWRTSLDDVITLEPDMQSYLDACADTGNPAACNRIERRADGSIRLVDARHANGASLVASGYDFDLGYRMPLAGGELSSRITASHLDQYDYVTVKGADTIHAAGTRRYPFGALPRWRGLGYLEYARGDWSASYQAQYIGSMRECGQGNTNDFAFDGCRTIDDTWYQDVRLQFSMKPGPTLTLAINNLGNVEPPRVNFGSGANTDPAAYQLLGRTYYVSLSYRIE
ncbi:MAG TPA: TonB-dependent receptor [Steroidobacteraceae bacterium]|nr:TonB-dependent receptor [Steroidobacteraceae bacterium]